MIPSQGTVEEKALVNLTAGKAVDVLVEYTNTVSAADDDDQHGEGRISQPALMRGVASKTFNIVNANSFILALGRLREI